MALSTASRPPGSIFMRLMTKIFSRGPAANFGSFHVLCTSVLSDRLPTLSGRVPPHATSAARVSAARRQVRKRVMARFYVSFRR